MSDFLKVDKVQVLGALDFLGKVIAQKARLPVLGYLRLNYGNGRASLTATNLDEFLTCTLELKAGNGNGEFLIPFAGLRDFARSGRKQGSLSLTPLLEDNLRIADGDDPAAFERVFHSLPVKDWPGEPVLPKVLEVCPKDFLSTLRLLAPSVAVSDSRRALKGVCVENGTAVATDGKQLVRIEAVAPAGLRGIIPVTKLLNSGCLSGDCQAGISGSNGSSHLTLKNGQWTYTLRLIDGPYPSWRQAIPDESQLPERLVFNNAGAVLAMLPGLPLKAPNYVLRLAIESGGGRIGADEAGAEMRCIDAVHSGKRPGIVLRISREIFQRALMLGHKELLFKSEYGPVLAKGGIGIMVFMPILTGLGQKMNNPQQNYKDTPMDNTENKTAPATEGKDSFRKIEPMSGAAQSDPFEELAKAADELRLLATGFARKLRDAQAAARKRERDFRTTRELLGKLKTASGF